MRALVVALFVTLTVSGIFSCSSNNTPTPTTPAPTIGTVTWTDNGNGTGTLSIPVSESEVTSVTVTISGPAALVIAEASKILSSGTGTLKFFITAPDPAVGASGTINITADASGSTDTDSMAVTLAAAGTAMPTFAADTLYAYPVEGTAAVGDPVTILVVTGAPANALQFLASVGFVIETEGTYVPNSFNFGAVGGARTDTDGYWALMGPPAPDSFLDLGDDLVPGTGEDLGFGTHRYTFGITPQGPFAAPATLPDGHAVLFSFQLTFSAAGTYHPSFQRQDGTFSQTFYYDADSTPYFWGTLDSSFPIVVH